MLRMVLTDRHREVLRLTAQGLRVREVADRLWLSESTVKQHLAEARWRLHAPNTTRAVVIALIQGELSLADLSGDPGDSVTIGVVTTEVVTTTT